MGGRANRLLVPGVGMVFKGREKKEGQKEKKLGRVARVLGTIMGRGGWGRLSGKNGSKN